MVERVHDKPMVASPPAGHNPVIFLPTMPRQSPMRIRLTLDRRAQLLEAMKAYFTEEFDDELSDFRAQGLLDFFIRELGPPIYNQGVRDAASFVQSKLSDIEGEVYEGER
jgi:uncharacterized protein (DUF2164 family)